MAFNKLKFTSVSGQTIARTATEHWTYETQDNKATVSTLNYFLQASTLLNEGNVITVRHMSTPTPDSTRSTVLDEIDYVVVYKGSADNIEINGVKYHGNKILVYPLQKGEQCLVKYIDNIQTFNNENTEFNLPVGVTRVAIVADGTLGADLTIRVKESSNAGIELNALQMTTAQSGEGAIVESPILAGASDNVNTVFNIAGNTPANSAIPVRVLLIGSTDAFAHHAEKYHNMYFTDLNAAATQSIVCPHKGKILKLVGVVNADPGAGNATFTASINGVAVTNGVVTVPNGSMQYASADATPTANHEFDAQQTISIATTATNAVAGWCTIVVQE